MRNALFGCVLFVSISTVLSVIACKDEAQRPPSPIGDVGRAAFDGTIEASTIDWGEPGEAGSRPLGSATMATTPLTTTIVTSDPRDRCREETDCTWIRLGESASTCQWRPGTKRIPEAADAAALADATPQCLPPQVELRCRLRECRPVREAEVKTANPPGTCKADTDCKFVQEDLCVRGDGICNIRSVSRTDPETERSRGGMCRDGGGKYIGPCELPRNSHPACNEGICGTRPGPGAWITNACERDSDCTLVRNCPVCRHDGKCDYSARSLAAESALSMMQNPFCNATCGTLGLCNIPASAHARCIGGVCAIEHQPAKR